MRKLTAIIGVIAGAVLFATAYAADNYNATEGSGKTFACLDISTVCFPKFIPYDSGGGDMTDTTNHALKVVGIGTAQGTATSGLTGSLVYGSVLTSAPTYSTGTVQPPWVRTTGQMAVDFNTIAGTTVVADPCQTAAKIPVPISQTTSTKIVSQAASKKNYVCSILVNVSDAESVSLVEGTGSTCGTSTAAIIGATSAANGLALAANSVFARGNGNAVIASAASPTANTDVCLLQSGSGRLAGIMMMVQQ